MQPLGTLTGGTYSSAKAINDSGIIVGESGTVIGGNTFTHAFVCLNGSGSMHDLGTLGGSASSASAINSAGEIVGYSTDSNDVSCAFLYNRSTMLNLNNFIPAGSGWTNLASGDAINDAGQIAGSGFLTNGQYHAYLLTPVVFSLEFLSPRVTNRLFQVTIQGGPGQQFAILASTDLTNWASVSTNTLTATSTNWTDPTPVSGASRYYRAWLLQ